MPLVALSLGASISARQKAAMKSEAAMSWTRGHFLQRATSRPVESGLKVKAK